MNLSNEIISERNDFGGEIHNPNFINKTQDDIIAQTLKLDREIFEVIFKKEKYKILILCEPKDEVSCLYYYSTEKSLSEFQNLGKTFKLCENIDDIFKLIKNLVAEVKLTKSKKSMIESNISIHYSSDDSIFLLFKIPLLTGDYEEIKIEFNKLQKDIAEQFKKLKDKYLTIKRMIIQNNIEDIRNEFLFEYYYTKKK